MAMGIFPDLFSRAGPGIFSGEISENISGKFFKKFLEIFLIAIDWVV